MPLVCGWSDNLIPPRIAINDYRPLSQKSGAEEDGRNPGAFMVRGMLHGPGTDGAENFDFDNL